jgi:hypothetical protein
MSQAIEQSFEKHDAVHVLFGCGTSIQDEIAAHVYMIFGTTAKVSEMHKAVADKEHRKVLSGIVHLKLIGIWLGCLPRIAGILIKCLPMKKRIALRNLTFLKNNIIRYSPRTWNFALRVHCQIINFSPNRNITNMRRG